MPPSAAIELRLSLRRPTFALEVDLSLPGRGVTAVYGPSGSGKTSLLRCVAGLEHANPGRVSFRGQLWQDGAHFVPPYQREIGYVFQEARLFPHLTVLGNLEFAQRRCGSTSREGLEQAVELLGIGHLLQRNIAGLSGGERQRVAIARALASAPRLLLLDEPLASLDAERKAEILPYLERLQRGLDLPILLVSHQAEEVARLADYLVVLREGRVLTQGPLFETLAKLDPPVRLGEHYSVVLEGVVAERSEQWQLLRAETVAGNFWVRDNGRALGERLRVRILADDVSLALEQPRQSSILNTLPGVVESVLTGDVPSQQLVRLRVEQGYLLAQVTRRSFTELELQIGSAVWVQVKSAALIS